MLQSNLMLQIVILQGIFLLASGCAPINHDEIFTSRSESTPGPKSELSHMHHKNEPQKTEERLRGDECRSRKMVEKQNESSLMASPKEKSKKGRRINVDQESPTRSSSFDPAESDLPMCDDQRSIKHDPKKNEITYDAEQKSKERIIFETSSRGYDDNCGDDCNVKPVEAKPEKTLISQPKFDQGTQLGNREVIIPEASAQSDSEEEKEANQIESVEMHHKEPWIPESESGDNDEKILKTSVQSSDHRYYEATPAEAQEVQPRPENPPMPQARFVPAEDLDDGEEMFEGSSQSFNHYNYEAKLAEETQAHPEKPPVSESEFTQVAELENKDEKTLEPLLQRSGEKKPEIAFVDEAVAALAASLQKNDEEGIKTKQNKVQLIPPSKAEVRSLAGSPTVDANELRTEEINEGQLDQDISSITEVVAPINIQQQTLKEDVKAVTPQSFGKKNSDVEQLSSDEKIHGGQEIKEAMETPKSQTVGKPKEAVQAPFVKNDPVDDKNQEGGTIENVLKNAVIPETSRPLTPDINTDIQNKLVPPKTDRLERPSKEEVSKQLKSPAVNSNFRKYQSREGLVKIPRLHMRKWDYRKRG